MTVRTRTGGGGGTIPDADARARDVRRTNAALVAAGESVSVRGKDGKERFGPAPVSFQGNGVDAISYDNIERQTVVSITVPILISTAAARPTRPGRPSIHIATDTGEHSSFDGTTWRTI